MPRWLHWKYIRTDFAEPEAFSYWSLDNSDLTGLEVLDGIGPNDGVNANALTGEFTQVNEGFYFDGYSSKITVPDDISFDSAVGPNGRFSFMMWLRPLGLGIKRPLVTKTDESTEHAFQSYIDTDNRVALRLSNLAGDEYEIHKSTSALTENVWSHVSISWEAAIPALGTPEVKIYINGVDDNATLATSVGSFTQLAGNSANVIFGTTDAASPSDWYDGYMDEILFWDRPRSPTQIASIYQNGLDGYRQFSLLPDPVSYWTLDNADLSGTTVLDVVGTNDGTNSGATTGQTGVVGESFTFASPDVITVPNDASLQFTTAMSVSAWTYHTEVFPAGFSAGIAVSKDAASPNRGFMLRQTWQADGRFQYIFDISTTGTATVNALAEWPAGTTQFTNRWTHLVGTYDGYDIKLYVDGELLATTPHTGTLHINTQNVEIGARTSFASFYWQGDLDEVAVWNTALDANNVRQLYNYGIPNIPSPVLALSFDDADTSGSVLTDKSYRGNNGTLVNAPTTGALGQVGQSYLFNGSNEYLNLGNISDLNFETTDTLSISLWFKVTSGASQATMLSKYSYPAGTSGWQLFLGPSGHIGFSFSDAGFTLARYATTTSTAFRDNAWHHVVFTYDGTNDANGFKFYVDGIDETVTIGLNTDPGSTLNSTNVFVAGRDDSGGPDFFTPGNMDELYVFTQQLTEQQAAYLYAQGAKGRALL